MPPLLSDSVLKAESLYDMQKVYRIERVRYNKNAMRG